MLGSESPLWEAGANPCWGPSEEPHGQASGCTLRMGEADQVEQLLR